MSRERPFITKRKDHPNSTWWARCDGILRAGPYRTQAEAAASLLLTDGRGHAPGAFVWPETPKEPTP